jgi:hypothetical protein
LLTNEATSAAAALADSSSLDIRLGDSYNSTVPDQAGQARFRASDLFHLQSATPVHNLSSGIYLIIRACREDQYFSVSHTLDVTFGLSLRCSDAPEFPHQLQFKFDVRDLCNAGDGKV